MEYCIESLKKVEPKGLPEKQSVLFTNKKFLKLVDKIVAYISIKSNKSEKESIQIAKKFIKYFLESDFYHWRYRIEELLKIKNLGVPSEKTYKLKYNSKWEERWNSYRKSIAMTLENQIKKYGKEEGTRRWNSYCKRQSETNTFEYKHKKYGISEEEFKLYNKSRACTLENMIIKYGEQEGIERWNSYCERQKYAGCALEYFQEKYGEQEGILQYQKVNNKKKLTKENFIRKYGETKGKQKFFEYLETASKNTFVSKISQEFFDELYNILPKELQNNCYYHKLNNEYLIYVNGTCYYYDFVLPSLKYCIEFNGDYWHANPAKYNPTDLIRYPNHIILEAHTVWERDIEKHIAMKRERNYDIDIVWESDYKKDHNSILEISYEKIMQRYKLGID